MKKWIINNKKGIEKEIIGIGSGGNINKIFFKSEKKGEAISINTIYNIIEKIKPLSFDKRMTTMGMRPDRADVIDHAGSIYLFIIVPKNRENDCPRIWPSRWNYSRTL